MKKGILWIGLFILLASSTLFAWEGPWWDSNSQDQVKWESRIKVELKNKLDYLRKEVIEINLKDINLPEGVNYDSIRVVDPTAKPDENNETGGNDLLSQIDDADLNGKISAGDKLAFLAEIPTAKNKIVYLYYSKNKAITSLIKKPVFEGKVRMKKVAKGSGRFGNKEAMQMLYRLYRIGPYEIGFDQEGGRISKIDLVLSKRKMLLDYRNPNIWLLYPKGKSGIWMYLSPPDKSTVNDGPVRTYMKFTNEIASPVKGRKTKEVMITPDGLIITRDIFTIEEEFGRLQDYITISSPYAETWVNNLYLKDSDGEVRKIDMDKLRDEVDPERTGYGVDMSIPPRKTVIRPGKHSTYNLGDVASSNTWLYLTFNQYGFPVKYGIGLINNRRQWDWLSIRLGGRIKGWANYAFYLPITENVSELTYVFDETGDTEKFLKIAERMRSPIEVSIKKSK